MIKKIYDILIVSVVLVLFSCEEGLMQKELRKFNEEVFGEQIEETQKKIEALYGDKGEGINKYLSETYNAENTNVGIGYFGEKHWVSIRFYNPPENFGDEECKEAAIYVYQNINKEELTLYKELRVEIFTEEGFFIVESNQNNVVFSFSDLESYSENQ